MRRNSRDRGATVDIWPGFVDALSTLIMGISFMLVVFVLGQFFLSQLLQGRSAQMTRLETEVRDLAQRLQLERDGAEDLRRSLARLTGDVQALSVERDDLQAQLGRQAEERDTLQDRLTQALNQTALLTRSMDELKLDSERRQQRIAELEREIADAQGRITADRATIETQVTRLAELQAQIATLEQVKAALEAGKSEEQLAKERALAEARLLSRQIELLGQQLEQVSAALALKQDEIQAQGATIADLGQRLNLALADKVAELSAFRSDFFGRMRSVLEGRQDVRVVGDRFVFQSELLFDSGSAELRPEGREQMARFAQTLRELIDQLPSDLPWILRVDGHTDKRPINTPQFRSNWELSTARAIAVATFLIEQGVPANRIAATGFADNQPLDPRDSEDAYRRNRRIEMQITNS